MCGIPSSRRSNDSPRRFFAVRADSSTLHGAVGVVSVSSWGAAGGMSTVYTVNVAAGAALDLANNMQALEPGDGEALLAWAASLASLSCQGFHRFVLASYAGLRVSALQVRRG